jgi:hypothetical protein
LEHLPVSTLQTRLTVIKTKLLTGKPKNTYSELHPSIGGQRDLVFRDLPFTFLALDLLLLLNFGLLLLDHLLLGSHIL